MTTSLQSIHVSSIQRGESLGIMKLRVLLVHVGAIASFFQPLTWPIAIIAVLGYTLRVGGLVIGYHRLFAHRAFVAGRLTQFILAWLGAAGGFRGPLWWASVHRQHHRYSDNPGDPHSPLVCGRWHAHLGFIFEQQHTNLTAVEDLACYPELLWLNKYHYVAPYSFMAALFVIGQWTPWLGATGLGVATITWGFFLPTFLGIHAIAALNSVTHGVRPNRWSNTQRFETQDSTTNCWWLALPTMGESWHNNHHKYPFSARCGLRWVELDIAYYVIWLLAKLRLVHRVRVAPR